MMEDVIDSFIRFLAVERGLSENYQLSTQRSLSDFAHWCAASKKIDNPHAVTLAVISEYLAHRKRAGLSASSIKLIVVALKIFFRARHQVNNGAHLANREKTRAAGRTGEERLSSPSPTQLRDPSARKRRRFADYPGDAGPRRYFDHASLYACRSAAA